MEAVLVVSSSMPKAVSEADPGRGVKAKGAVAVSVGARAQHWQHSSESTSAGHGLRARRTDHRCRLPQANVRPLEDQLEVYSQDERSYREFPAYAHAAKFRLIPPLLLAGHKVHASTAMSRI